MSSAATSPQSLYNPEVEANALAICLKHGGEVWGEFHLTDRGDWSRAHQPLFDLVSLQLNATPSGSLDPLLLAERARANGISSLEGGFEIFPYLEGLCNRYVEKTQAAAYARELKRLRVRRDLIVKLDGARRTLVEQPNVSFEGMTSLVERELSAVTTAYHKPEVTEVMGEGLIEVIERRAANPVKPEDMLYMGPFDSINRTIGPAIMDGGGSVAILIARTGSGKSALSFYWCVHMAEKYGLPLLWLDAAEMSVEQLQMRAVCCLSNGRVPLWAVRSGEWDKDPVMRKIVRNEVWPRVRKLSMSYKNVGMMSPTEKIATIRRHYYSKVGRDQFLLIGDDYIKGVEAMGSKSAEWQMMGYYMQDVKTLITDEIRAGYWTSLQGNRSVITQGKKAAEINDSGEAGASISDRIIQQATVAWLLRYKIPEELAREKNMFGNMVLKKAKLREGYGRDYEKIARAIKSGTGFVENFWHIQNTNFHFEDRGLHSDALATLGQSAVDLGEGENAAPRVKPL